MRYDKNKGKSETILDRERMPSVYYKKVVAKAHKMFKPL